MNNHVNLLWTGGTDSTYRLIDLYRNTNLDIYPFYIKTRRKSAHIEIDRMHKISEELQRTFPSQHSRLKAVRIIPYESIPNNTDIDACYWRLREGRYISQQYNWLARFAYHFGYSDLEISAVRNGGHAYEYLNTRVKQCVHNGTYNYKIASSGNCEQLVFGCFLFPILYMSKDDIRRNIANWRLQHVFEMTWFCCRPIMGRYTCGTCRPCVYVMDEGSEDKMHWIGRIRFKTIERGKRMLPRWLKSSAKRGKHSIQRSGRWLMHQ